MQDVHVYECWGVKESFEIKDVYKECTEYPEKRSKKDKKKCETPEDKANSFKIGTEEYGLEITSDDIIFIQDGKRKTWSEMISSTNVCPCCGRKL